MPSGRSRAQSSVSRHRHGEMPYALLARLRSSAWLKQLRPVSFSSFPHNSHPILHNHSEHLRVKLDGLDRTCVWRRLVSTTYGADQIEQSSIFLDRLSAVLHSHQFHA